jgi:hypothetical protein
MGPHRTLLGTACSLLLAVGCVTDHDLLAAHPGSGGARSTGGSGGSSDGAANGGSGGLRSSDARADGERTREEAGSDARASADVEPPGSRKLTLLHGVIDTPWIGFCFAIVRAGVVSPVAGSLWPPGGIDYARSATVTSLSGAELGKDDLLPYLVAAASRDVVTGLDCRQILDSTDAGISGSSGDAGGSTDASIGSADSGPDGAGPQLRGAAPLGPSGIPAVRVVALPEVPAVAFAEARSFLLVVGGCMGGPGVSDPSQQSVCGEGYSSNNPTLTEIVVRLPRTTQDGRVGLSFMDATPAVRIVDRVEIHPTSDGTPITLAQDVAPGGVKPLPPSMASSASDLGANVSTAKIQLFADASPTPMYTEPWATTYAAGAISGLQDGKNYTLLLVGPYPGFSKRNWWNDPVVTIVPNDP